MVKLLDGDELKQWVSQANKTLGRPNVKWSDLLQREWIGLTRPSKGQSAPLWQALADRKTPRAANDLISVYSMWATDPETAVLRAFVASVFGEVVMVAVDEMAIAA